MELTASRKKRIFGIGLGMALLIGMIGVGCLSFYLNPLAQTIVEQQIRPRFGDRLQIGSIAISLWSGSIIINDVSLAQPPSFGEGSLLRAKRIQVQIGLAQLLKKQWVIRAIIIDRPVIKLVQLNNGSLNTEYYLAKLIPTETAKAAPAANAITIHLRQFLVRQGSLSLNSPRVTPREPALQLNDCRFELKELYLPNPAMASSPLRFSGVIAASHPAPFASNGRVLIGGKTLQFQMHTKLSQLELSDFQYLLPDATVTVRSGRVNLISDARCQDGYLASQQHVTIDNLKVASTRGGLAGFAILGLPAQAFAKFIADNHGVLTFNFNVSGDFNHLKLDVKKAISAAIAHSLQSRLRFLSPVKQAGASVTHSAKKAGVKVKQSIKKLFRLH